MALSPDFLKWGALIGHGAGQVRIAWGKPEFRNSPDPVHASVYLPDFFLNGLLRSNPSSEENFGRDWAVFPDHTEMDVSALAQELASDAPEGQPHEDLSGWSWAPPSPQSFLDSFFRLQSLISSGQLMKGVPVVFDSSEEPMSSDRLRKMLMSLSRYSSAGRIYGFWILEDDEKQGILGLTPEDLFEWSLEGTLRTFALAGTRRKSREDPKESARAFLKDPKERREHELVIEDIREALSPLGKVVVGETGVLELPTLFHLKTPIHLHLQRRPTFEELVRLLHPTAALGAFPRKDGKEWLWEEERISREEQNLGRIRFGAPFGWVRGEEMLCVVAIRNIQWTRSKVLLGSGCGVIAESNPDREWAELQLKRDSVRKVLGIGGQ